MVRKRITGILTCMFVFLFAAAVPALAASGPGQITLVSGHEGAPNVSSAVLTFHFDKPMTAATEARAESALAQRLAIPQSPSAHGPQGAYLYCDHFYSFSDGDGRFTFQHKCGGGTGPWGYQLSVGLCSIVVSDVHEDGMAWHRNGKKQGTQHEHTEFCRYQFHGTFNPDRDYDFISYSDTFTFKVDIGGEVGNADLVISGSFTSAGCKNRVACGR
jgi:hypothetical protein